MAALAAAELARRYPHLRIEYVKDGYFVGGERGDALVRCLSCDVVVAAMGSPLQEDFLFDLEKMGWSGDGYTCGGYLDQLISAGTRPYYPQVVNRLHLRWLFRILKEPRRLLPRYAYDYPIGLAMFVFDLATKRLRFR